MKYGNSIYILSQGRYDHFRKMIDCQVNTISIQTITSSALFFSEDSDILLIRIFTDIDPMYINFDNRRLQRVNLLEAIALFVDSGGYYKGELKDISYDGFRVDFPSINSLSIFWPDLAFFFRSAIWRLRKFRIVIRTNQSINFNNTIRLSSGDGKSFLVSAYPRWMKKKDTRLEIGFKIPASSVSWQFFVLQKMLEEQ